MSGLRTAPLQHICKRECWTHKFVSTNIAFANLSLLYNLLYLLLKPTWTCEDLDVNKQQTMEYSLPYLSSWPLLQSSSESSCSSYHICFLRIILTWSPCLLEGAHLMEGSNKEDFPLKLPNGWHTLASPKDFFVRIEFGQLSFISSQNWLYHHMIVNHMKPSWPNTLKKAYCFKTKSAISQKCYMYVANLWIFYWDIITMF